MGPAFPAIQTAEGTHKFDGASNPVPANPFIITWSRQPIFKVHTSLYRLAIFHIWRNKLGSHIHTVKHIEWLTLKRRYSCAYCKIGGGITHSQFGILSCLSPARKHPACLSIHQNTNLFHYPDVNRLKGLQCQALLKLPLALTVAFSKGRCKMQAPLIKLSSWEIKELIVQPSSDLVNPICKTSSWQVSIADISLLPISRSLLNSQEPATMENSNIDFILTCLWSNQNLSHNGLCDCSEGSYKKHHCMLVKGWPFVWCKWEYSKHSYTTCCIICTCSQFEGTVTTQSHFSRVNCHEKKMSRTPAGLTLIKNVSTWGTLQTLKIMSCSLQLILQMLISIMKFWYAHKGVKQWPNTSTEIVNQYPFMHKMHKSFPVNVNVEHCPCHVLRPSDIQQCILHFAHHVTSKSITYLSLLATVISMKVFGSIASLPISAHKLARLAMPYFNCSNEYL